MRVKVAETIVPNEQTPQFHVYSEGQQGLPPGVCLYCSHLLGELDADSGIHRPYKLGAKAMVELERTAEGLKLSIWKEDT